MPRPPLARERVLDAFVAILIEDGERAATLEATAKAAGVSKGGLLYHFGSKDELAAGLLARLKFHAEEDIGRMNSTPEGALVYFLRTSVLEDAELDRVIVAVARLAQNGNHAASDALRAVRDAWADALRPHVRDESALDLVMLLSDGLYYNSALNSAGDERAPLAATVPSGPALEALIALVVRSATTEN